jgi:RNA polymerase sigma-70 factor (ECF subfamily)
MSPKALTSETEAIWREFHARLRAFVSRRVRRPADVEDVLQEVFVRIHLGIAKVQDRERLPAWIFQITRNAIVDHFRSGGDRSDTDLEDYDAPAPESDGAADLRELEELSTCIEPMIAALPESYREAIRLTDLNGLTQIEAARRSGVSTSGMKSRVQRARRQLREMLEECCRVELDRRGGIVDYSVREEGQSPCGPCKKSD